MSTPTRHSLRFARMLSCVAAGLVLLATAAGCPSTSSNTQSSEPTSIDEADESFSYEKSDQIPVRDHPMRGPADAKVTIAMFCPMSRHPCGESMEIVDELQSSRPRNIRLAFIHVPFAPQSVEPLPASDGPGSEVTRKEMLRRAMQKKRNENKPVDPRTRARETSDRHGRRVRSTARKVAEFVLDERRATEAQRFAIAARDVGLYWQMVDVLMETNIPTPRGISTQFQQRDDTVFEADRFFRALDEVSTKRAHRRLQQNLEMARSLRVWKVPTLFINGRRVVNPEEIEPVRKLVKKELKHAETLLESDDVDRRKLYRRAVANNLDLEGALHKEVGQTSGDTGGIQHPDETSGTSDKSTSESNEAPIKNRNFTDIDAGYMHTCGIKSDGDMRCWGAGSDPDEDGVGHNQASPPPGKFRAVSGGYEHTCAIRTDGLVDCWSYLYTDEFGSILGEKQKPPVESDLPPRHAQARMLPDGQFEQIDATETRTCGIETDGTAVCWSDDPDSVYSARGPLALDGTFQSISPERAYHCLLEDDGSITCKGNDAYGRASPPDGKFVQLVTGGAHACARRDNGTVECWGRDYDGQASPPDLQFQTIDADGDHSCGVTKDGHIECWGLMAEPKGDEHHDDFELFPPPNGEFTDVTVGLGHNCALRPDSSVLCWGIDGSGQVGKFGEGYDNRVETPPPEHDRSKMPEGRASTSDMSETAYTQLAIGNQHVCAVRRDDGGLDCWGEGSDPDVEAEGGTYDYDRAYPPNGTYTQVVGGRYHSCGLRADGWVDCWGKGTNTTFNQMSEYNQAAPKAGEFTAIASGIEHVCGLRPDGTIDCWGRGYTSEAGSKWGGRGSEEKASPPDGTFVALDAAGNDNCALDDAGNLECWTLTTRYGGRPQSPPDETRFESFAMASNGGCGLNTGGQPVCWGQLPEPPDTSFTDIEVGSDHACGLRRNGTVECWGDNDSGQTIVPRESFATIQASGVSNCGILRDSGRVQCWGGYGGALNPPGRDASNRPLTSGRRVGLEGNAVDVAVGQHHSCARMDDGEVRCWGGNDHGQLGVGDREERRSPEPAADLSKVTELAAGDAHTCAATRANEVYCWGSNGRQQLGLDDEDLPQSDTPRKLPLSLPEEPEQTERDDGFIHRRMSEPRGVRLSAAANHSCLVDRNGRVHCWGDNNFGQLGTGWLKTYDTPVRVRTIGATALDVDVTINRSCALRSEGDLFCWGRRGSDAFHPGLPRKQLERLYLDSVPGASSTREPEDIPLPSIVEQMPPARQMVAGKHFLCGQTDRTTLACIGEIEGSYDFDDILDDVPWPADGGVIGSPLKDKYSGEKSRIVDIDAGRSHVCAVLAVGRMFCWGGNRLGQLGTGGTETKQKPIEVEGVRLASDVAAGPLHTCARTHRGGVKCWGDNRYYQLGRSQ